MNQFFRLLSFLSLTLFLTACHFVKQHQSVEVYKPISANDYLAMASHAPLDQQATYQLQAIQHLLDHGQTHQAQQVLSQLDKNKLPITQHDNLQLARAQLALQENTPEQALALLSRLPSMQLSQSNHIQYSTIAAEAYEKTGNILASLRQRLILQNAYITIEQKQHNEQAIWQTLQSLSAGTLASMQTSLDPQTELAAWLQLAYFAKKYARQPRQLLKSLQHWREQYPDHPGNTMIAQNIPQQLHQVPDAPKHLALLLPLSGKLAGAGKAVRDGFLTAYYQAQTSHPNQTVEIIDTNQQTDPELLSEKLQAQEIDFVIGPLSKEKVAQYQTIFARTNTPMLALNYPDTHYSNAATNYEFGLSPLDEATQMVDQAWLAGLRHIMLIAPQGDWGERQANLIKQRWYELGGNVVTELNYNRHEKLSAALNKLLQVQASQQRKNTLAKFLDEKLAFTPRRRQDLDGFLLIAKPDTARQIKPLLKFYFAGDLPVYASSLIYTGTPNRKRDKDMDGILFCDSPWILQSKQTTKEQYARLKSLWPIHFKKYIRLYALGIDAYHLSDQIGLFQFLPRFGMPGATGNLYLNDKNQIFRQLQWARITNGRAVTVHLQNT